MPNPIEEFLEQITVTQIQARAFQKVLDGVKSTDVSNFTKHDVLAILKEAEHEARVEIEPFAQQFKKE